VFHVAVNEGEEFHQKMRVAFEREPDVGCVIKDYSAFWNNATRFVFKACK
jgi:hypothetical protein